MNIFNQFIVNDAYSALTKNMFEQVHFQLNTRDKYIKIFAATIFAMISTLYLVNRYRNCFKNAKITPQSTPKAVQTNPLKNDSSHPPSQTNKQPEIIFTYSDNKNRFCLLTKQSHLTPIEQIKIDHLSDYFQANITKLTSGFKTPLSCIQFGVIANKKTNHNKIKCYLSFEPNSKNIKSFCYKMSLSNDLQQEDEGLAAKIEQAIQESISPIESLINQIETEVTYQALFKCFEQIAAEYQFQPTWQKAGNPLIVYYETTEQKLYFESCGFSYTGKWTDGQPHYQYLQPWQENKIQYCSALLIQVDINLAAIEMLSQKFLTAFEKKFRKELQWLVERTTDCQIPTWPNFNDFFEKISTCDSVTGNLEEISETLSQLEEQLCLPKQTLTALEVTEQNLEEIKKLVKINFKQGILKFHPDKTSDPKDAKKAETIISLYKQMEANYKARGLIW